MSQCYLMKKPESSVTVTDIVQLTMRHGFMSSDECPNNLSTIRQ